MEPRAWLECSAKALIDNFRILHREAGKVPLVPMIKADAYGHGAAWAARTLLREKALDSFGVATLKEGEEVRAFMGAKGRKTEILVFSGALPWSEEKGRFCQKHALTPVLGTWQDWERFRDGGWARRLSYELKFNTGMNRLGIGIPSGADPRWSRLKQDLRALPEGQKPRGILSHLAAAENPKDPRTCEQVARFRWLVQELSTVAGGATFHVANSSAIWNFRELGLPGWSQRARPGISLYGIPPWAGAKARGLRPVMRMQARVLEVRTLAGGEGIGYGFTYSVPVESKGQKVAILGLGYADGLPRRLSNRGFVTLGRRREPFLGIISMDLSAVACSGRVQSGQAAQWLGPGVDLWELARLAESVPYELLTSVGARVERIYGA